VSLSDPSARLADIPELHEILRRGLLSKVRVFEIRCETNDRLLQVLQINRRPLAITKAGLKVSVGNRGTSLEHRGTLQALWLDLPIETYISSSRNLDSDGRSRQVFFRRLSAECAHERVSIPADWLIHQIQAGTRKVILTDATRMEMGSRPRGT
jgi:hypothetical protein